MHGIGAAESGWTRRRRGEIAESRAIFLVEANVYITSPVDRITTAHELIQQKARGVLKMRQRSLRRDGGDRCAKRSKRNTLELGATFTKRLLRTYGISDHV